VHEIEREIKEFEQKRVPVAELEKLRKQVKKLIS
jgi:hypothetical protein